MGTSISVVANKRNWNLSDLFTDLEKSKAPETIREYPEDILTLSCCLQRTAYNQPNGARFNRSLNNPDLPPLVTDLDRMKAENIRKYYKDKLLMFTLQGRELTKYRKDLQKFLHGSVTHVPDSLVGIVYRLPYFYDYDKEVDDIFKSSYFKNNRLPDMREDKQRDLTFLKKIENQRRHVNNIEYWFQDSQLNKVMFSIKADNPLLALLDRQIGGGSLSLNCRYNLRKKDFNEYFTIEKWTFV